jgi:alpha-tubulin suppressor-like RCC1 family protein
MERKSQIAAGGDFSLVLCSNNQLYSFGNNRSGQLGLESKIKSGRMPRPLKMASLGQIAAISAGGSHSLLLNSQGQVFSFGSHQYGQLGLGPLIGNCISGPLMIKTSEIGKIIAVSAGEFHSLILNDQGQVFSFGNNNHGQLGQGDLIGRNVPTLINPFGIGWIIAISAGGTHSLILNDQGQVFGFGYNGYAQFGLGDKVDRLVPILIDSIGDIVAISAGGDHSLFLNDQGQVFSCGSNICGQLGLGWRAGFGGIIPMLPGLGAGLGGPMQTFNLPMLIDDPKIGTIVAISAGSSSSFILNSQGQIFGFGNGQSGRLGIGNSMFQYSPVLISGSGIGKVLDITTGQYHSLLLNDQGQIYSFGDNESGRLGLGDTKEKWVPMLIEKLG